LEISKGFKQNIAKYFFDKEIALYDSEVNTADDGWTSKSELEELSTFEGNVQFNNFELVRETYGISEDIDITISTHEDIEIGSIVGFNEVLYNIYKVLPHDSHNLLIGKKWLSE
jgi:hypothetical protein